jgi:hypothetical protein
VSTARAPPFRRCRRGVIISQTPMRAPGVAQTTLIASPPSYASHAMTRSPGSGSGASARLATSRRIEWASAMIAIARSRSACERTCSTRRPPGSRRGRRGHHISGSLVGARSNPAAASGSVTSGQALEATDTRAGTSAAAMNATRARASAACARDVSAHSFRSGCASPVSTANHPLPDARAGARPPLITSPACSANVSQSAAASIARSYGLRRCLRFPRPYGSYDPGTHARLATPTAFQALMVTMRLSRAPISSGLKCSATAS